MKGELKVTTRGRYAVMAMVELAVENAGRPVPLSEIADRNNISLSYLEQLVAALRRKGLVNSHRGPGGGYLLAKKPGEIFVSEILDAAEDSIPGQRPTVNNDRINESTRYLWSFIGGMLYECLSRISLAEVVEKKIITPCKQNN